MMSLKRINSNALQDIRETQLNFQHVSNLTLHNIVFANIKKLIGASMSPCVFDIHLMSWAHLISSLCDAATNRDHAGSNHAIEAHSPQQRLDPQKCLLFSV